MNGPFGRTARFWRRVHLGRNPLARRSDRVEAALLLVVVLGLLIALPLAALVGSTIYRGQLAVSVEQQASRHLTTATLIEDVPAPVPAADGAYLSATSASRVHARWALPGGAERIGTVAADPGTTAGTEVPVWLSAAGDPVAAPLTSSDVATTGVLSGVFSWLVVALGLIGVYRTTRLILDRRRAVRWDREWLHVGDRWARS